MNRNRIIVCVALLLMANLHVQAQKTKVIRCNVVIECLDSIVCKQYPKLLNWDTLSFTRYEPKSNRMIRYQYCNQSYNDSCRWIGNKKILSLAHSLENLFNCRLMDARSKNIEIVNSYMMAAELKKRIRKNSKK